MCIRDRYSRNLLLRGEGEGSHLQGSGDIDPMMWQLNNRPAAIAVIAASLCSCTGSTERTITAEPISGAPPIAYRAIEDNIQHDTLLIQTTFDLGDGSFIMVASNIDPSFEGIRLYRYRLTADSSVSMLAISPPAYDSWTMLPTFFGADSMRTDALWLLANFGERESWGQKLLLSLLHI